VGEKQKYLKWVFTLPKELCYNFLSIAGSSLGYKHTEKTRAKLSDANKGENNPMFGKSHTPETLVKISASMTGKTHSEDTRAKISEANTGKTLTPETGPKSGKVWSQSSNVW